MTAPRPGWAQPTGQGGCAGWKRRSDSSSPEKTTQLLFRGAQAYMDHAWEEGCATVDLPESPKPGPTEAPRASRGQMLIGPDGRLTRSRAQASEAEPAGAASGACSSCVRAADGKAACGQCERALCGRCVHTCCSCGALACPLCAVVEAQSVYNVPTEQSDPGPHRHVLACPQHARSQKVGHSSLCAQ